MLPANKREAHEQAWNLLVYTRSYLKNETTTYLISDIITDFTKCQLTFKIFLGRTLLMIAIFTRCCAPILKVSRVCLGRNPIELNILLAVINEQGTNWFFILIEKGFFDCENSGISWNL